VILLISICVVWAVVFPHLVVRDLSKKLKAAQNWSVTDIPSEEKIQHSMDEHSRWIFEAQVKHQKDILEAQRREVSFIDIGRGL
jgi:hypothetical protein